MIIIIKIINVSLYCNQRIMSNLTTIAKLVARNNPEAFREAEQLCAPMLANQKLIPEIFKKITEVFPEMDRADQSIMFTACTYTAYAPATLLNSGIERAPNGLRSAMCEVMQWNNSTVVNHYQSIARAYCKGSKFQDRISSVLSGFQQFSIKSQQTKLF